MRTSPALHAEVLRDLGHFVLEFQAVEAALVALTVELVNGDPEYISTLTAELEFTAKARALDVIYARWAQLNGRAKEEPFDEHAFAHGDPPKKKHPAPEFHKLIVRVQNLAARRNELVHSFYSLLITVDQLSGLARSPTRLNPSIGERERPEEDVLPEDLQADIAEMYSILTALNAYRMEAIDVNYPDPQ